MISIATSTRGEMCKRFPGAKRAVFSKGYAEAVACQSLDDLKPVLKGLAPKQALIMGSVKGASAGDTSAIGTKKDCRQGEVVRLKEAFIQSRIFIADYDFCQQFRCRSASEVHANLCRLLPDVFEGAGYLATKSSSSRVLLHGKPIDETSWHLYFMADDAFKIRFLADALMQAAEAQGMTYTKLSSDGKSLTRTVIDLMPLKIGACGLVYEAPPAVSGDYSLADSRIRIVKGDKVKTSILHAVPKQAKRNKKEPVQVKASGYFRKSRKFHYSSAYRSLTLQQAAVLEDIVIEWRGGKHGTDCNPIVMPCARFRVNHRRLKTCFDALVNAGFIRYVSGYKSRKPNCYFLNFTMLDLPEPKGWQW